MSFATEFTFTLPKGFRDADGRVHREGTMRLATAKDEIIPLQDSRVKNNRAYLVVLLLSRVITRLGELQDEEISPAVIENLYSADLSFLQAFYRQINETGGVSVPAQCPHCAARFDVELGQSAPAALAS